jgi:DNA-binding ferritin-like protein
MNKTRRIHKSFENDVAIRLLSLLTTIKLYHWNTSSYATHKATDELYDKLNKNMDRFIEVLLGKLHHRLNVQTRSIPIKLISTTKDMEKEISNFNDYLMNLHKYMKDIPNTDLYSIRDEIMSDLNQFLYLLTFS